MSRRIVVALVIIFVPACGAIGVREVKRPALFADRNGEGGMPPRRGGLFRMFRGR